MLWLLCTAEPLTARGDACRQQPGPNREERLLGAPVLGPGSRKVQQAALLC